MHTMKKTTLEAGLALALLFGVGVLAESFASTTNAAQPKVDKTMTVARCQAIMKDGSQCPHPASEGKDRCWRHRGAVNAVGNAFDDAGKEAGEAWLSTKDWSTNAWRTTKSRAGKAWRSTKDWSTNAWQKTKTGADEAWQATKDAFDEAGEEISEEMSKVFKKERDGNSK